MFVEGEESPKKRDYLAWETFSSKNFKAEHALKENCY